MFASLILKELIVENEFNVINLLEKVERLSKYGITRLIIAPFYYDEESKSSIEEVKLVVEDLNLYLSEKALNLKLYPANIIRDNFDNIKDFVEGKIGSINDNKYVLLSPDESNTIKELVEIIYEFNLRDYTPIIFGPEKIKEITDDNKNINKLLKENCLLQLDLGSINGEYGKKVLKTAKDLKKKDVYSFIGFEDDVKKEYINKEVEGISKKGLFALTKNGEANKRIKVKKKIFGRF